jgi:hypothetical protein
VAGYFQDCGRPMLSEDLGAVNSRGRLNARVVVMSPDRSGYSEIVNYMWSVDGSELVLFLDHPTPVGTGRLQEEK